jgi:hypothetical protein
MSTVDCSTHSPTGLDSGGERLGLQLVELLLGNRTAIQQALSGSDLFGWVAPARNALNVLIGGGLSASHLSRLALAHPAAACDQVNDRREEWKDDQEDDPQRLPPPAQIPVTEQINNDLEQHHQVAHEEEGPDQKPEPVRETIHHASLPLNLGSAALRQPRHTLGDLYPGYWETEGAVAGRPDRSPVVGDFTPT